MLRDIQKTYDKWFRRHRISLVLGLPIEIFEQMCDLKITGAEVAEKEYRLFLKKGNEKIEITFKEQEQDGILLYLSEHLIFKIQQSGKLNAIKGISSDDLKKISVSFIELCVITKLSALALSYQK